MRQRAWPESIVAAGGDAPRLLGRSRAPDRSVGACSPARSDGEILGWAACRHARGGIANAATPGTVPVCRRPRSLRGEGHRHRARRGRPTSAVAPATRRSARTRRGVARRADRAGRLATGVAASRRSRPRDSDLVGRSAYGRAAARARAGARAAYAFAERRRSARSIYELDLERLAASIPNEEHDAVALRGLDARRSGARRWSTTDASLVALRRRASSPAVTMIRVDRPSGRAENNLAGVRRTHPRPTGLALLLKSHEPPARAAELGATIAPHRQRRDERADARRQHAARLPAVRAPAGVGAGSIRRYQLTVSSMFVPRPERRTDAERVRAGQGAARTSPCSRTSRRRRRSAVVAVSISGPPFGACLPSRTSCVRTDRARAQEHGERRAPCGRRRSPAPSSRSCTNCCEGGTDPALGRAGNARARRRDAAAAVAACGGRPAHSAVTSRRMACADSTQAPLDRTPSTPS